MRILIIQRHYMHYRKKLIEYLNSTGEFNITVLDTNTTANSFHQHHISLKSNIKYLSVFDKKYEINFSIDLLNFLEKNCISFDIVILEGATNIINNFFIIRLLKRHHVPFVWWDAGRRIGSKMTPLRKLAQPLLNYLMRRANACIAYSNVAKDYMISSGVSEEKIFICQNTLNVSYFDQLIEKVTPQDLVELKQKYNIEGKKIILYVGALQKRKRIDDLIYAFSNLHRSDCILMLVGDGDYRYALENLCKDLDLRNIVFTGEQVERSIYYFLACDFFVLPSEGGLALNQAMICSKPIIASSADGTERELIIDGKNGFLFEEGNVSQLTACLDSMLKCDLVSMGNLSRNLINDSINERRFKESFSGVVEFAIK